MPVQKCREGGKPGFKWGKGGRCYTYAPGSKTGAGMAKNKAIKQGCAMGEVPGCKGKKK